MNSKKSNLLFLTIILVHFEVVALLMFAGGMLRLTLISNLIVSELIIIVPAILFMLFTKAGWKDALGFHKIKLSSFFMIILFTFLCMPLVTVLNAFSMLFVDNAVASMQSDISGISFPIILFLIGIYGPFCEEFVFRGVIFNGYKRSENVLGAILLSSLLFGLMHLNINQALYAFAIGVLMAFLVEATGSLWGSTFCHMIFNSQQVCMMYFSQWLQKAFYGEIIAGAESELTVGMLVSALSVYLLIAAITTPLAICVLAWIAKNEKKEENLRRIWRDRNKKEEYLMSIPLIVAIVISLAYMSLELMLN